MESEEKEDQNESCSEGPNNNSFEGKNIILGFDEYPDTIIEKILITIFNDIIIDKKNNEKKIISYQQSVKDLCKKNEYCYINLLLLTNIRNIIKKYRKKIFEMPSIIELRENDFQKYYLRSYSIEEKYSKNYINFGVDRALENSKVKKLPDKKRPLDYYATITNLLNKLKGIKRCLRDAAPIIEKAFELPLSMFEKFSIMECANEDFLNILIHDGFIWNEIMKNKGTKFAEIIKVIMEGDGKSELNTMNNKIKFFNHYYSQLYKISEMGRSLDHRRPEDAKPVTEINYRMKGPYDNINNIINENENHIYFHAMEADEEDMDMDIEEQTMKESSFANINMIKFNGKNINNINDCLLKSALITSNKIKGPKNLGAGGGGDFLSKNIILNKKSEIIFKNKKNIINKNKKENNKGNKNYLNTNKNPKEDKKKIPSDIDDLVKYIENDNKNEKENNKKKKRNKKRTKKKNKNENDNEKKEENSGQTKEEQDNDEIKEIKENFLTNSINKYNIYKIKFKYKPKWLDKLSKYE